MKILKLFFIIITWPVNYIFYKLYNLYMLISNTDTPYGMSHIGVLFGLIILNIITLYQYFWRIFPPNWLYLVILIIAIPYAIPQIADKILNYFSKESETTRIIGNFVVTVYIILSIVLFSIVIKN